MSRMWMLLLSSLKAASADNKYDQNVGFFIKTRGEASVVKSLLCMHRKQFRPTPSTHVKIQAVVHTYDQHQGGREFHEFHWSASLVKLTRSRFSERLISKRKAEIKYER